MSSHIISINLRIWIPGSQLAADEMMLPFDGRSHEITNIPNKPHPIGVKVWGIAQSNFLIVWNYHTPGEKGGPLNTRTPRELGGSKGGKGGNRTQAVVAKMIGLLPQPGECEYLPQPRGPSPYHLWLDNLFTSTRFLEYMRNTYNIGISGTTRQNAGILEPILDFVKGDKGQLPWGTKLSLSTPNGQVAQIAWKDQGKKPTLMMSTVMDGTTDVEVIRKRPKQPSKREEWKHKPFKGQTYAVLGIPEIFDCYNYQMGPVDGFDHLCAMNSGLRQVRRGVSQAIDHWLLRVVLVNTYVIGQVWLREEEKPMLRSQIDWRQDIIEGLLEASAKAAKNTPLHPKASISHRKRPFEDAPRCNTPDPMKLEKALRCKACLGLRQDDRPLKRQALAPLATANGRTSTRHETYYCCRKCRVPLCTGQRDCMNRWHRNQ